MDKRTEAPDKNEKRRKVISITAIVCFVLIFAALFIFAGKPLVNFVKHPDEFRSWVDSRGFIGRLAFVGMMIFQVVIAIIPGEPFEIIAGYAFGALEGTILCIISTTIGGIMVFLFVRYFGYKAIDVFFPREKINSLRILREEKKLNSLTFILFLIPGTPKDVLTYAVGLTNMKLTTWIFITSVARIPSIVTSTIGGDALGLQNYEFAVIVFAVTIAISIAGIILYNKINLKKDKENEK